MEFSHNLQMHPLPQASPYIVRRFWGIVHRKLLRLSRLYCRWHGIPFDGQIMQLPFGLILKWSDGTRAEEVLAMEAARRAGMPVPRVICYGEQPDSPHAPVSILMTRLPGRELGRVYEDLDVAERDAILNEMNAYLSSMRQWKSPWGRERICSSSGTSIRSVRVPFTTMGPFETEDQMNDYLLFPAGHDAYDTEEDYPSLKKEIEKLFSDKHRIVYTHGDLKHHNILIHEGHVSGFIDWESAGWYPEYWEFTTALRFQREDFWWYDFVVRLGGHRYTVYRDAERALITLTGGWCVGW
ncbi:APH-domain-containing protein [Aureobasidium pullulans]|uniref:APH-domain-containing protein n=1 Tax=Aureobasidium pullulans TaxID=5580 RepID=A0A4S8SUD4_AURPU|nr:APH-domain-containing protein [Aureobasidium pullulans]